MQTNVRTPTDIFNQPQRLLVPLFQRPYVWNMEKQWEPLWRDVERLANRVLTGRQDAMQPHFLGAVVIQQIQNTVGDLQSRIVIDGQQRLTTLQIMLDAVHAVFLGRGLAGAAARLEFLVENAAAFRRKPEDQFKVWPTNRDREAFNEVMGQHPPIDYEQLKNRNSKLVQAHRFFYEQTLEWLDEDPDSDVALRANALEQAMSNRLQLVVIDLQVDENAQEIFETLNARGTPLTPVDLIKNFVFQRLSDEGEDVEKIYLDYWKLYETEFWEEEVVSGRLKRPRAVVFFNHWLFSILGEDVTSGEVFAEFKRFLLDRPEIGTLELVKRIHRAAMLYEDLTKKAFVTEGDVDRVGLFVYRAEQMQSDVVKTLLLALLDPDRSPALPRETVDAIIEDVESWLIRRMLCRELTKGYTNAMGELITIVRREPANSMHAAVRDFLARQRGDSAYWPDDAMVRRSVSRLPVYKRLSRVRVRMILEAIEDNLRGYGQLKGGLTGVRTPRGIFTIEHLMPQAWEANWPPPKDGDAARRNELLHTIGNLTLVTQALNSKVSNGAWEAKSAELNKHGVVLMNTRLHEYGATPWTDESIENRTQACIDAILDLWRVPEGHEIQTVEDEARISQVSLRDLLRANMITAGMQLFAPRKRFPGVTCQVTNDGYLVFRGMRFGTPSGAGCAARDGKATNGWEFWFTDEKNTTSLAVLRMAMEPEHIDDSMLHSDENDTDEGNENNVSLSDAQFKFWSGFVKHVRDCDAPFVPQSPQPSPGLAITIGRADVRIAAVFATHFGRTALHRVDDSGPELRVDFKIWNNDELFSSLLQDREVIEKEYGQELVWYRGDSSKSRRIMDSFKTDILDETRWPEYYDWLTERIVRMREVMGKRV